MGAKNILYNTAILLFIGLIITTSTVYAGEVDILIRKLVEKGILTQDEAEEIAAEVKTEAAKEVAVKKAKPEKQAEEVAAAPAEASAQTPELPKWVQNTKLKGDLRIRYQYDKNDTNEVGRSRGRFRYRLGIESKLADILKVGAGIASGGDNPRSTDQNFQDVFSHKSVRIDYAYAELLPVQWVSISGGKIKNPVYETADMLWDTDINPEGGAAQASYPITPQLDVFLNSGVFILDESEEDSSDPFMAVVQPGFTWKITESADWKFALAYYGFYNVKGTTLDWSSGSNTLENGVLKYRYDSLALSTEAGIKDPLGMLTRNIPYIKMPYAGIFSDFVVNPNPHSNNIGYLVGLTVGEREKVTKKNQWQAKAMYRYLGKDAWLDTFPDSNAYNGETGVLGPRVQFEYGIMDNFTFMATYYWLRRIEDPGRPQNLFQADLNFRF